MPTATEFFGIAITNFGPLTTTYTPPPSCTTATTDHLIYAIENVTGPYHGAPSCEHNLVQDCIPDGSSYDTLADKIVNPWAYGFFNYHSPGIYCPKGWTTAAVLGHGDKTGSELRSGAFTNTQAPSSTFTGPSIIQPDKVWLSVLEPSETLAFCCPRYCSPCYLLLDRADVCFAVGGMVLNGEFAQLTLNISHRPTTLESVFETIILLSIQLSLSTRWKESLYQAALEFSQQFLRQVHGPTKWKS